MTLTDKSKTSGESKSRLLTPQLTRCMTPRSEDSGTSLILKTSTPEMSRLTSNNSINKMRSTRDTSTRLLPIKWPLTLPGTKEESMVLKLTETSSTRDGEKPRKPSDSTTNTTQQKRATDQLTGLRILLPNT